MKNTATAYKAKLIKVKKGLWRMFHNHSPDAKPVFILGVQRSGTTLLTACFERSMDFGVFGENSSAMSNYRIKDDAIIQEMIMSCRHPFIVFKPLTDSHRALDFLAFRPHSSAIWMFRRAEDRANSAVQKSGNHNLVVLRDLAQGRGFDRWQAQGLFEQELSLIRQYNYDTMSPYDAAALLWYLRNSLFFKQHLDVLDNVLPLAYEDLVSDPLGMMRSVAKFLGAKFNDAMVSTIHSRSIGKSQSHLSPEMAELCNDMYRSLHAVQKRRMQDLGK